MKLTFWGTSHGLPEKGRYCTCTMLEVGDNIYFIDAGAPLADIMVNHDIPYERVKAIFITHAHLDHSSGLPVFIGMQKWFKRDCDTGYYLPDEFLYNGLHPFFTDRPEESNTKIHPHVYQKGVFYDDGVIQVEAIPTQHMSNINRLTYAFKVTAGDKSLIFTGDLSDEFQDFPEVASKENFDAVVCELTHFSIESAIPKLNAAKTKKMIFNHVRDDKIALLKESNDKLNFSYTITNDGDIIEV
ncbi:MAG: MBL fold metallo-hydrolase [Clostridia bacterium]|nr:MBL fold metallo-hydrolase [Clostridia bacterium]